MLIYILKTYFKELADLIVGANKEGRKSIGQRMRRKCDHEGRNWNDEATSQRISGATRSQKMQIRKSPL